jgi:hypothetical protein
VENPHANMGGEPIIVSIVLPKAQVGEESTYLGVSSFPYLATQRLLLARINNVSGYDFINDVIRLCLNE